MEQAIQWLASWVSVENNGGNSKSTSNGGGSVRATDLKDTSAWDSIGGHRHHHHLRHDLDFWRMGASSSFVRLAGVSGALAIGFGAYGAHGIREKPDMPRERVLAFDSGNRYHLIHSVALMAVPMARYPVLTGSLFSVGMLLFSGTCYYYALTGRDDVRRLTPMGGIILILAWLSLVA